MPTASTPSDELSRRDAALFTDLYQLTMLQAYLREDMHAEAVFDLFVRDLRERNYLIACGLEQVLAYLETVHFTDEALEYLAAQDAFEPFFIDYLAGFSFHGDVYALPEGTPAFADEPLLEVVAPIGQAQLVETFLLNQVTFQTNLATKAHRVAEAAEGRTIADFGARRMHGTDAALKAARAGYIAGLDATSNVLAGQRYGLPITGTMAHSYIEAHDREMDAFRAFAELYPETTLLVDTYDTLAGVRKVIALAEEWGEDFAIGALRLDSGDLGALAQSARRILDEAGLQDVKLFASGSLDEHRIQELVAGGAPIDGFGVGTRLGVIADQPGLDSAYKLSGYAGTPRMKLSSEKSNLPGRKQIYRFFGAQGSMERDVIATAEEDPPEHGRPLLQKVMAGGERTDAGRAKSLDALRAQAEGTLKPLPERLRALDRADDPYPVERSEALDERLASVRRRLEEQMDVEAG